MVPVEDVRSSATVKPENLLSGFVDAETVKKFFFLFVCWFSCVYLIKCDLCFFLINFFYCPEIHGRKHQEHATALP